MVTKINPIFDAAQPRAFLEKTISTFTVTTPDIAAATEPGDAIDAIIKTVSLRATILAHGAMGTANEFWIAGEFPEDDYNGDGTPTTFAAQLQADIRALGATVGTPAVDLSAATVAAGTVYKADQV